jgi:DNA-binding MarR family transcriptional regulator
MRKRQSTSPLSSSSADSSNTDGHVSEALDLLLVVASRIRECRDTVGELLGLTAPQFAILIGVQSREARSGITIRALAKNVQMAPTHVTTEVGRLVKMQLLAKLPNRNDGRSVLVKLTPRGLQAVSRVAPLIKRSSELIFKDVRARSFVEFSDLLHTLAVNSELALDEVRRERRSLISQPHLSRWTG